MVRFLRRDLILFCSLIFVTLNLYAQHELSDAPSYKGVIHFYARGSGDFSDLVIFEALGSPLVINLYNGRRSSAYNYEGRLEYGIFRQSGVSDGMPQYQLVGKTTLDSKTDETLILILPNPLYVEGDGSELEFLLFSCNTSLDVLPWDHVAFWNLTGAPINGVVGNERLRVEDGLSDIVSIKPYLEEKGVKLGLSIRFEGKERRLLSSRRSFYPDRRILFVILPPEDPDSLSVIVFRITEIRPRKPVIIPIERDVAG